MLSRYECAYDKILRLIYESSYILSGGGHKFSEFACCTWSSSGFSVGRQKHNAKSFVSVYGAKRADNHYVWQIVNNKKKFHTCLVYDMHSSHQNLRSAK